MRRRRWRLVVAVLLLWGCQPEPPPEVPVPPPPEDLSQWTVPTLVQPPTRQPLPHGTAPRPLLESEKVYPYVPGQVYKVTVALDAPLDVMLEAGEKIQMVLDSDPKPIVQGPQPAETTSPEQGTPEPGTPKPQLKARWEYREAVDGAGEHARPHLLIRALEADASAGVTITTSRRTYYLTCKSTRTSPVRGVRWTYAPDPSLLEDKPLRLLPHPDEPRLYHIGYEIQASSPLPAFIPRHIVDDGRKMYLIYPEIILFKTVPLVRAITSQGPAVVNAQQYLNVVVLDALYPRLELRIGPDSKEGHAEVVTITQGRLRTIDCPTDPECPLWPEAAQALERKAKP